MKIISNKKRVDCFGSNYEIAANIKAGEVFGLQTYNHLSDIRAWKRARKSEKPKILNVTGPVYIQGAKPGNILKIDILDLKLTSKEGTIVALPGKGGLKENFKKLETKIVKIDEHFVHFSDSIRIPIKPMIGKIGVAPAKGNIPSSLPGPHGGNMDNKQINVNSTVYLPIFVDGAFLGIGDIHALMGDGESAHSGVETEGQVILRCEVLADFRLTHPMVCTSKEVMTVAEGKTLEDASKTALQNMAQLIMDKFYMSFTDSSMLISIVGDLRICQIVNNLVSVRVAVPRIYCQ